MRVTDEMVNKALDTLIEYGVLSMDTSIESDAVAARAALEAALSHAAWQEVVGALSRGVPEDTKRLDWLTEPDAIDRHVSQCLNGEWCAQDDVVSAHYGATPREAIDAAIAAQRKEGGVIITIPDNWTPTAANINALPKPLREYIMRLSTDEKRAGLIAKVQILEGQLAAVNRMLEEAPVVKVRGKVGELTSIIVSHTLVGKRVRLVVCDE